jgi:hypothetical protein
MSSDHDTISHDRMSPSIDSATTDTTESHPMVYHHISTDLCGLTDDDPHAMIDKKSSTNLGSGMNLYASQESYEYARY